MAMTMTTRLTERLEVEYPMLLAPMAFVSGGRLAAAVTAAGGLGIIGGGYGDAGWLEQAFNDAGGARVGCGFITWSLARSPQLLDLALERQPVAIMLSFGDPAPFAERIKGSGTLLICQVQTLVHARHAIDVGADIIVAQGAEAGGHGRVRGTFPLVPAVVDLAAKVAPGVCVVAAGGIADGRGLVAALALGADGALIGTRFWASTEALVSSSAQRAALAASGDDTVRTSVYDIVRQFEWPEKYTLRTIRTRFVDRWHGAESSLREAGPAEVVRYEQAVAANDFDTAALIVGESIDLIHDVAPAGTIVRRIVGEAQATSRRIAGIVDQTNLRT